MPYFYAFQVPNARLTGYKKKTKLKKGVAAANGDSDRSMDSIAAVLVVRIVTNSEFYELVESHIDSVLASKSPRTTPKVNQRL